jgi:hypothetical protein
LVSSSPIVVVGGGGGKGETGEGEGGGLGGELEPLEWNGRSWVSFALLRRRCWLISISIFSRFFSCSFL